VQVAAIHAASQRSYGRPRIVQGLRGQGLQIATNGFATASSGRACVRSGAALSMIEIVMTPTASMTAPLTIQNGINVRNGLGVGTIFSPLCFSHPCLCCLAGGAYQI
jgi:hypothetical protein